MGTVPVYATLIGGGTGVVVSASTAGVITISTTPTTTHRRNSVPVRGDVTGAAKFLAINVAADGSYTIARDTLGPGAPVPLYGIADGYPDSLWVTDDSGALAFSLGLGTARTPAASSTFNIPGLPIWSAAVRAAVNGIADATVLWIGDSHTAGNGAGEGATQFNNAREHSFPSVCCDTYGAGLPIERRSEWGTGNYTEAQYVSYVPTTALGAGWTATGSQGLGAGRLTNSTTTNPISKSYGAGSDTFDVWCITTSGAGVVAIDVDGGTATTSNLNTTDGVRKITVTGSGAGAHVLNIARQSGGAVTVLGWAPRISTAKRIYSHNLGAGSSKAADWVIASSPWFAYPMLSQFAPKLSFVYLGTNDWPSTLVASYQADITTLVTQLQALGSDVVLVGPPQRSTNATEQGTFLAALQTVSATLGAPLLDMQQILGLYAAAVTAGLMFDTAHPNQAGYNLEAGLAGSLAFTDAASQWYYATKYTALDGAKPAGIADHRNARYALTMIAPAGVAAATATALSSLRSATFNEWCIFTGASTTSRTYVNSSFFIKEDIAANAPRYDYANGVRQFLLEDASTNLVLPSQDLTAAGWTKTSATIGSGSGVAPDGATTPQTLIDTAATSSHRVDSTNISFTSGTTYSVSAFMKADTDTRGQLTLGSGAFSGVGYADFDLSGHTVSATGGSLASSGVAAYTGSWDRGFISAVATASAAAAAIVARINSASAARVVSYLGTAIQIDVWGVQVEASPFPTSYMRTVGGTATRAKETARITPTLEAILQRAAATIVSKGQNSLRDTGRLVGGATSNALLMRQTATTLRANNVGNLDATFGSGSFAGSFGIGIAFDGTGRSLCANGGTVVSDANGPGDCTTVYLAQDAANTAFGNGWRDSDVIYPSRLSNASLQAQAVAYV